METTRTEAQKYLCVRFGCAPYGSHQRVPNRWVLSLPIDVGEGLDLAGRTLQNWMNELVVLRICGQQMHKRRSGVESGFCLFEVVVV